MHTIGFILEQGLGHRTHSLNLQTNVPKDSSVQAIWSFIEHQTTGLAAKIPFYNRNWTLEAGMQTRRAIAGMQRETKLDALFFHTQVMAVLAIKWVKQIPSIISLDATPLQYDKLGAFYNHKQGSQWLEAQKWRLNRNCFHHAKQLVAWSQWAKASLVADYEVPAEKVTVIPPGITVADWQRPMPRMISDKMQEGPVKILFVGGDLKRKGGLDLINAFRQLTVEWASIEQATRPAVELHLVTTDNLPSEGMTSDGRTSDGRTERSGIHLYQKMKPNSSALKALFQECDLFCLPTYGDCLPLSLIEASAAGLPSITTIVGGTAEVVHDERTGFRIPIGDQAALIDRLRLLITNPQLRLQQGTNASRVAQQRFNAEHTTGQLLTLLKATTNRPVQQ